MRTWIPAAGVALALLASCSAPRPQDRPSPLATAEAPAAGRRMSARELQALVMGMADDYGSALAEAVYLVLRSESATPRSRWLAQSFLRNGMGAAIDIGAGSNPSVALLDLLVLGSLQRWAFETHWMPAGVGPNGTKAVERLTRAEQELWTTAARALSPDQIAVLHGLVDQWIAANPDRTVVSLVRFGEFAELRRLPATARATASGLLADVEAATAAVEDATLLGERALWYVGRLPYILGQQAELTAYRMADQPEADLLRTSLASFDRIAATAAERLHTLDADLSQLQAEFFARLGAERAAIFTELEQRQHELLPVIAALRDTVRDSDALTRNLTTTIGALDRLFARFDRDPGDAREPLDINDITAAAAETSRMLEQLTALVERANDTLSSPDWDLRLGRVDAAARGFLDLAFWRAAGLALLLLLGLALLRLVPRRSHG